jgi:integrase
MARPRQDGLPPRVPYKRKFTDSFLNNLAPDKTRNFLVWDLKLSGFALAVYPSGMKVWKCIFPFGGRTRWYSIGRADQIDLKNARKLAADVLLKVAKDIDPQAERRAARSQGTFRELAEQYVEQHAKKHNKSWHQASKLVQRFLVPRWGSLQAGSISRSDVKSVIAGIASESVASQTLAHGSAIFSWAVKEESFGVKVNPCQLIDRVKLPSRERVLSDSEVPLFWQEFDGQGLVIGHALKVLLLTGQRPGEVGCMRCEHIVDDWWQMPGKPVPSLGWPGTKNKAAHRVYLTSTVRELIAEIDPTATTGFVFASRRGKPVRLEAAMQRICAELEVERATPHDLRRSNGTAITSLGFGKDGMSRIQNHKEGGIASVYDRFQYAAENQKIMEAVTNKFLALIDGDEGKNVYRPKFANR